MAGAYEHLATKADIAELRTDIANLKADLIKWMILAMAIWGGVIIAALRLTGQ